MTTAMPGMRPANPHFSSGPCAKRPGWSLQALTDAALGRSHRAKVGKAKLKRAIDLTREVLAGARRLQDRHRSGFRHRRRRNGDVVDAGRAPGHHARLGILRRRLGHRRRKAAQTQRRHGAESAVWRTPRSLQGRSGKRRGVHLERHDLRRARAERQLDRGRPQGRDDLRRDLGRLRAAARFRQARCRHLLLAEGARRRSRARHADPVSARGRTAGKPQAGLAAAEDFPPHQGRQADQRHLRRRNHQHAVHAVRRGLYRHAAMGEIGRRIEGADRARRRQRQDRQRLGCAHALDRESRRRSGDALQHIGLPQDRRSGGREACRSMRNGPS